MSNYTENKEKNQQNNRKKFTFKKPKSITGNDKDTPKDKKLKNIKMAESFKRLGYEKKFERMLDCGTSLEVGIKKDGSTTVLKARLCKIRLCPFCSWRKSLKMYLNVAKITNYITENYQYRYIMLTLTSKNVKGEDLNDRITHMMKSLNQFTKYKRFQNSIKGWYRALEVTHNLENNEYHPHFHMILAVNKSYFNDKDYYINQKEYQELWQKALKEEIALVDIRVVKEKNGKDINGAVSEVAKYTVKDSDILNHSLLKRDEILGVLSHALNGRRLVAFGGTFKVVAKILKLEENELDFDEIEEHRNEVFNEILNLWWDFKKRDYYIF